MAHTVPVAENHHDTLIGREHREESFEVGSVAMQLHAILGRHIGGDPVEQLPVAVASLGRL